jgi:SAM-dependent methyltransferase
MPEDFTDPFARPDVHERAAAIVRRSSTNRIDVRDAMLDGLELSGVARVLELGCGFGFVSEAVARRVNPGAEIFGVDAVSANQEPFVQRVAATGRKASFVGRRLQASLPWPDRSFGLVVCSYSLYFFPEIVPDVARVLTRDGVFVAVTHRRDSFAEMFAWADLPREGSPLDGLLSRFHDEEGERLLAPHFGAIEHLAYPNTLRFGAAQFDDLLEYARFKLPLMAEPVDAERLEVLATSARRVLERDGRVDIAKHDGIFRCLRPR